MPSPLTSYICHCLSICVYWLGGAPITMLKMAFVPLQCTAGSRTAIALTPCRPSMP
jgi:hypothetical protein